MRIGGLALFDQTSSRRTVNLASYHSPHSLTWSWLLSVSWDGVLWHSEKGRPRAGFHPHRTSGGLQWALCLPGLVVHWHRQREMWFRDMWRRERDERDELEWRAGRMAAIAEPSTRNTRPTSKALH